MRDRHDLAGRRRVDGLLVLPGSEPGHRAAFIANQPRLCGLLGLLGVALVTGGLLLLERAVVTDKEQVENSLFGLSEALVHNDLPAVLNYVSPRSTQCGISQVSICGKPK